VCGETMWPELRSVAVVARDAPHLDGSRQRLASRRSRIAVTLSSEKTRAPVPSAQFDNNRIPPIIVAKAVTERVSEEGP